MFSRRRLLFGLLAGFAIAAGTPALAQDDRVTRGVVRQLEQQGFDVERVSRTLLGRVRILARRGDQGRELVFDPRNGTILRDFIFDDDDDDDDDRPRVPDIRDADDHDDDRDDDDDDRDDDDNDDDDDDDDDDSDDGDDDDD